MQCSDFGKIKRWGKIKRFNLLQEALSAFFLQHLSRVHFRSKTHRQQIQLLMRDWKTVHQLLRSHRCQSCPHISCGPLWLFQGSSSSWYDDVQIVGRYQTGDHAGRPAVTQRHVGAGWVWYYGATMSQQAAVRLIERLGIEQAASHLFGLPQEIELVVRRGENAVYFILLNYQEHSVSYTVKARLEEILLNVFVYGEDQLEKYGVRIYRAPLNCPV